jgi:hypothetical protein
MDAFKSGIFGARETAVQNKAGMLLNGLVLSRAQEESLHMVVPSIAYTTLIDRLVGTSPTISHLPDLIRLDVVKLLGELEMFLLLQFRSCPKETSICYSQHPKLTRLSCSGISDLSILKQTGRLRSPCLKLGNPRAIINGAISESIPSMLVVMEADCMLCAKTIQCIRTQHLIWFSAMLRNFHSIIRDVDYRRRRRRRVWARCTDSAIINYTLPHST